MNKIKQFRSADHTINPNYIKRWSSRAFLDKDVPMEMLHSIFEAARWAPSAANKQPWQFVFAKTKGDRERFLSFINEGNVIWCDKAPVLVAVTSRKTWSEKGESINPTHAFDTGAAWAYLALEATNQGLVAHAMGGFDREKAKEVLQLPENYTVHAIVAIGYRGDRKTLTESLQEREKPSDRDKVEEFISEGIYKK